MSEQKIIVFEKQFAYSGLLSVNGFYRHVRDWITEHGYETYESHHNEQVFEHGKELFVEIRGENKLSDYALVFWETKLEFLNITEQRIELDDEKVKMNKGSVKVTSLIILNTDWDQTFEQNPFRYFFRVLIDKFIFKNYIYRAEKKAASDYGRFEDEMKRYLNMQEFR